MRCDRVASGRTDAQRFATPPTVRARLLYDEPQGCVVWIFTEPAVAEPPSALAEPPLPPFAGLPPAPVADSPGAPSEVCDSPFAERPFWTITLRLVDVRFVLIDRA